MKQETCEKLVKLYKVLYELAETGVFDDPENVNDLPYDDKMEIYDLVRVLSEKMFNEHCTGDFQY